MVLGKTLIVNTYNILVRISEGKTLHVTSSVSAILNCFLQQ
jgi:hypothetical protein